MLLEIWLFRTQFRVTLTIKEPVSLTEVLKKNTFDIVIISANFSDYPADTYFYTLFQLNIASLFLNCKVSNELRELAKKNKGVACISELISQRQLVATLEQLGV